MKNSIILNAVVLLTTLMMSLFKVCEICYVGVYLCEMALCAYMYKIYKNNQDVYLRKIEWLLLIISLLLASNIFTVLFHDVVKWIARPFLWLLSISYIAIFFYYVSALVRGKVKLWECCATIVSILAVLLTSLPVYKYYRLSYSVEYVDNQLVYKHYADALYEETVIFRNDTHSYIKTINQGERMITIHYNNYPTDISYIDTTFTHQ